MNFLFDFWKNVQPSLVDFQSSYAQLKGAPLYIFYIVCLLTALFTAGYLIQGIQVWVQLKMAIRGVKKAKNSNTQDDLNQIAKHFHGTILKHLWSEYSETLHKLKKASSGNIELTELRSTIPAETFFSRDLLVDNRLFDDFTRHLPGILTGLGIIGTFAGLLSGLQKFNPSDPATALVQLKILMRSVNDAFFASGAAIACAIIVVFISRLVLAYFYSLVEKLSYQIDSLYSAGAGEEYLARLVDATEQNEAHTAQLKDALIEDLNKLMTNLVEKQIAAQQAATTALGEKLSDSLQSVLSEPMKRVSDAMETTSKGNGEQVSTMLENLLTGFIAKLEDTFGNQMRSINDQMQHSMVAMTAVQGTLQNLLSDVHEAGKKTTDSMSQKLEETMKITADNQSILVQQMRDLITEITENGAREREKSVNSLQETVNSVLSEVKRTLENIESTQKTNVAEGTKIQQQAMSDTKEIVGELSNDVGRLLTMISEQTSKAQANIDNISAASSKAIDGMRASAISIKEASSKFEEAGNSVTGVLENSTKLSSEMKAIAQSLQTTATAVQRGFEQYDATRKSIENQVLLLNSLIETAKKEAGVSENLIESIKQSAITLKEIENESRKHLESVNLIIKNAFEEFGNSLVAQIKMSISETDAHIAKGTGLLAGVVQELAAAMQQMRNNE